MLLLSAHAPIDVTRCFPMAKKKKIDSFKYHFASFAHILVGIPLLSLGVRLGGD